MTRIAPTPQPIKGIAVAIVIILLWATVLAAGLSVDFRWPGHLLAAPLCLLLTFLYTGVFITAHDAMHGLVAPGHRTVNTAIGTVCSIAFALFSFRSLQTQHWKHHKEPATANDPDYHDGKHVGFIPWYVRFIRTYVRWQQILGLAIVFNILHYAFGISQFNLIALWVLPNILSAIQLFTFGTYLPHREPSTGYDNPHRARSTNLNVPLSFLTCYHFGYHLEHHQYPYVPWWDLPRVRRVTAGQSVSEQA